MDRQSAEIAGQRLAELYEPGVKHLKKELAELTSKQSAALNEIERENLKFSSINSNELASMFTMIKDYRNRVRNIKEEMMELSEQSSKLKARALAIQQHKMKEALCTAHYREAQMKREQDLIAKPDPNFSLP